MGKGGRNGDAGGPTMRYSCPTPGDGTRPLHAATHDAERVESRNLAPLCTASKAAATTLTTQYAKSWPDVKVNAADPGCTATDVNGHSGPQTVTEGTDAIVELATIGPDGPTGTFRDRHGEMAW